MNSKLTIGMAAVAGLAAAVSVAVARHPEKDGDIGFAAERGSGGAPMFAPGGPDDFGVPGMPMDDFGPGFGSPPHEPHGVAGDEGEGDRGRHGRHGRGRHGRGGPGADGMHGRMGEMRAKALERFDEDKDGTLSDSERKAAHEAFLADHPVAARHHAEMLRRFDADADGALSAEERRAAREFHREQMRAHHAAAMERFDKDGDGRLNPEERADAREERMAKMHERRAEALAEFDTDKNGRLDRAEREAMRPVMQQRALAQMSLGAVDENHDRALDEKELATGAYWVRDGDARGDFNGDGKVDAKDLAALLERASAGGKQN